MSAPSAVRFIDPRLNARGCEARGVVVQECACRRRALVYRCHDLGGNRRQSTRGRCARTDPNKVPAAADDDSPAGLEPSSRFASPLVFTAQQSRQRNLTRSKWRTRTSSWPASGRANPPGARCNSRSSLGVAEPVRMYRPRRRRSSTCRRTWSHTSGARFAIHRRGLSVSWSNNSSGLGLRSARARSGLCRNELKSSPVGRAVSVFPALRTVDGKGTAPSRSAARPTRYRRRAR